MIFSANTDEINTLFLPWASQVEWATGDVKKWCGLMVAPVVVAVDFLLEILQVTHPDGRSGRPGFLRR